MLTVWPGVSDVRLTVTKPFFCHRRNDPQPGIAENALDRVGTHKGLPGVGFRHFVRDALFAPGRIGVPERNHLLRHGFGNVVRLLGRR